MLIKRPDIVKSSEITSEQHYLDRRKFMQLIGGAAVALGASTVIEACSSDPGAADFAGAGGPAVPAGQSPLSNYKPRVVATDEALNSFEDITSYNNFYEFGTGKNDPQRYAGKLKTSPWKVKIDGHCSKPADYQLEDLIKPHQLEERIYRLRCVEGWSMVIPWIGIPARRDRQARGADVEGDVRPVHHAASSIRDVRAEPAGARLALRRGAPDGRGDAPADDPRGRAVRQDADEPERRPDPAGGAVEVRLQEHQVDRARSSSSTACRRPRGTRRTRRVRLLLERESRRRSPALESERPSGAFRACSRATRPRYSTATATRSPRCTPGWISRSSTDAGRGIARSAVDAERGVR